MSKEDLPSINDIVEENNLPSYKDFIEEKELPSIEDYEENELPSIEDYIAESPKEEVLVEEQENIDPVLSETAPEWSELIRLVNDVRKDIPKIPEIRYYDEQLEEICDKISQIQQDYAKSEKKINFIEQLLLIIFVYILISFLISIPFLLVNEMIWFLPIRDFLITNLFEFKVDIVIIIYLVII